jgi:hypothetical protein
MSFIRIIKMNKQSSSNQSATNNMRPFGNSKQVKSQSAAHSPLSSDTDVQAAPGRHSAPFRWYVHYPVGHASGTVCAVRAASQLVCRV